MAMRKLVRDDVRKTKKLLQRSNISPRCRQALSSEVHAFFALRYSTHAIGTISPEKVGNFYTYYLVQLLPLARNEFLMITSKITTITQ